MSEKRITESELILPSLYLMSIQQDGKISTSELIKRLEKILKPTGKDSEILKNRSDTSFSQKVRNLKSHNTFERHQVALYNNGQFEITDLGRDMINKNLDSLQYVISSGFDFDDVKLSLRDMFKSSKSSHPIVHYSETITEGEVGYKSSSVYKRSRKLRLAAIDHFSRNGYIRCDCCDFEFRSFYGEKFGAPCIEIHHLKPIFQYNGISVSQTIDDALKNLLPVCPNCHRVIHKNKITPDLIPEFKASIAHVRNIPSIII